MLDIGMALPYWIGRKVVLVKASLVEREQARILHLVEQANRECRVNWCG